MVVVVVFVWYMGITPQTLWLDRFFWASQFFQCAAMLVLQALYGNSVCLSVRLSHSGIVSKRCHVAWCILHCRIAKCVQFCRNQKNIPQGRPLPPETLAQSDLPLLIASSLDMFCLVAPQWKELAKKVQLWRIGSRIRAFQRAINKGSTPPLTSSKWG